MDDIYFSYISVTHNVIKILFAGCGNGQTFKSTCLNNAEAFSMREEEKFQIIWENAQRMPDMEKALFYELERKKPVVGLLMVLLLFAGGGLIYGGRAVLGLMLVLVDILLLGALLAFRGFGPFVPGEALQAASLVLVPLILALYLYAGWKALTTIEDYNERLYVTVFDRSPR